MTFLGMSGGWLVSFNLTGAASLELTFRYNLTMTDSYEADEAGEVLVSLDGVLLGVGANDYVARLVGDGPGTGSDSSTGWWQRAAAPSGS